LKDDFENIAEPNEGMFVEEFDTKTYESTKESIPFVNLVPHTKRGLELPLRNPDAFTEQAIPKPIE
jgi:hypothetical protein